MEIDSKLEKAFQAFNLKMTQKQMQSYLEQVNQLKGLPAVLQKMNQWAHKVGYLTKKKLSDNQHFEYLDKKTGVTFKTQINYARSNYTPEPLKGKKIPKLHCPICFENVGVEGKKDLRVFSFDLSEGRSFFIQQTPFPLFPYHFILIDHEQNPMRVNKQSLEDLTHFIEMAPGYVGCSNSDIEGAGASIVHHHHYQIFKKLQLPIMEAEWRDDAFERTNVSGYTVKWGLLNYPCATIKVVCRNKTAFIRTLNSLIRHWKKREKGNTANLVIQHEEGYWVGYAILRNPEFQTPEWILPIKSEGIGVIEAAGEGIYPVPSGDNEGWAWQQIEKHGLKVIKGIVEGVNPVAEENVSTLFTEFKAALVASRDHWCV